MNKVLTILLVLFFLAKGICYAQDVIIEDVLDSISRQMQQIKSYSATATFKVDIDFVNMPEKTAKIFFEEPDKFNVESDGFLMIPRIGMKPMMKELNLENYHAVYLGKEELNGVSCLIVKMIPKNRNNKIVIATLWIDVKNLRVSRWEIFTKKAGNIIINLFYKDWILPSKMDFLFELSGMNIPLKYFGNEVEIDKSGLKNAEMQQGKVEVIYENYQITFK